MSRKPGFLPGLELGAGGFNQNMSPPSPVVFFFFFLVLRVI